MPKSDPSGNELSKINSEIAFKQKSILVNISILFVEKKREKRFYNTH